MVVDRARERSSSCRHPCHRTTAYHAVFNVGCVATGRTHTAQRETCLDTSEPRISCSDRLDVAGDDGHQRTANKLSNSPQFSLISQLIVWAVLHFAFAAVDRGMLQLSARISTPVRCSGGDRGSL